MNYLERITFNPEQCGGRPCIRGMRIRVKDVLDLLATGVSQNEIFEDYPDLEADDSQAQPVMVWLRVGNSSNPALLRRVLPLWPIIMRRIETGDRSIEVF